MNCLKNLKKYFYWIGVLEYESNQGKMIALILNCFYLTILTVYMLTTFWYFLFNVQKFEEYSETIIFWSGALQAILVYVFSIWHRNNILSLFIGLEIIIEKSKKTIKKMLSFESNI